MLCILTSFSNDFTEVDEKIELNEKETATKNVSIVIRVMRTNSLNKDMVGLLDLNNRKPPDYS